MSKVILGLSDALRLNIAIAAMGYVENLFDTKLASLSEVIGELPMCREPYMRRFSPG